MNEQEKQAIMKPLMDEIIENSSIHGLNDRIQTLQEHFIMIARSLESEEQIQHLSVSFVEMKNLLMEKWGFKFCKCSFCDYLEEQGKPRNLIKIIKEKK